MLTFWYAWDVMIYQTCTNWGTMMRMQVRKFMMPLTSYWSKKKMGWDCFSQTMQYHSQAVGQRKRMWWDSLSQVMQSHSLAVCHRKRCDGTTFHKTWNATHKLLVMGKDVMKLLSTTSAMSLTRCWSYVRKDVMRLPFTKCAMLLTSC